MADIELKQFILGTKPYVLIEINGVTEDGEDDVFDLTLDYGGGMTPEGIADLFTYIVEASQENE